MFHELLDLEQKPTRIFVIKQYKVKHRRNVGSRL